VTDVQFTLCLTVAWWCCDLHLPAPFRATGHSTITVPLALVGTIGAMYVAGYSIDNLSLMGLTIAVGFVVDDAIVMIENIVRYIEQGDSRSRRAEGAGQIGFTIVSIPSR